MTRNRVKVGSIVTFLKYLASVVSLIFLPKTLIWNKITFLALNLLNFASDGKRAYEEYLQDYLPIFLFIIQFIAACCKDFKSI